MKILDAQGRLFGKISILDLGAALTILLVVAGIFIVPGSGGSVAQVGVKTQTIEIDAIVRGLSVRDPQTIVNELRDTQKTTVIIRNQPYGAVDVKSVDPLPRTVLVPQPDGSVKALLDPRPDAYSTDMFITLTGKAQITDNGPVLGNNKMKIGTPIELEGKTYNFNASVIEVRILD